MYITMVDVSAHKIINPAYQKPIVWSNGEYIYGGLPDPRGSYSSSFYSNKHEVFVNPTKLVERYGDYASSAGTAEYIDYNRMNDLNDNVGNGGLITDTHGTMLGGAVPELNSIGAGSLTAKTYSDGQHVPQQLKELPAIYETDVKTAMKSQYLERAYVQNDPNLRATAGDFDHRPIDYSMVMDQPGYTKAFLLESVKPITAVVNGLLQTKHQSIPNIEKLSFDIFKVKAPIHKTIQTVLDKVKGLEHPEDSSALQDVDHSSDHSSDGRFPNKFPDEQHAYSIRQGGWYQYLGPKTHIKERQARGDEPINGIDFSARIHDIEYQHMADMLDQGQTVSKEQVRASDKELVENIQQALGDEPLVGNVALMVINNKMRLEDAGLMDHLRFVRNHEGIL